MDSKAIRHGIQKVPYIHLQTFLNNTDYNNGATKSQDLWRPKALIHLRSTRILEPIILRLENSLCLMLIVY